MKSFRFISAALVAVFFTSVLAFAGDPTGIWKWSITGRDGQPREVTLKLDLKDGQLTGTMSGFRGDTPITAASFKDDQIAFSIIRELNGNKVESKYQGKLEGDTIKGLFERPNRDGEVQKQDWTATRTK
jgi:hypothetical protein